ncbi:hypothetical protein WCLP8_50030 [uncultured Gammaproteobacteria bacterium]
MEPERPPGLGGGEPLGFGFQQLRQAWELSSLRQDLRRMADQIRDLRNLIEARVGEFQAQISAVAPEALDENAALTPLLAEALAAMIAIRNAARQLEARQLEARQLEGGDADQTRPAAALFPEPPPSTFALPPAALTPLPPASLPLAPSALEPPLYIPPLAAPASPHAPFYAAACVPRYVPSGPFPSSVMPSSSAPSALEVQPPIPSFLTASRTDAALVLPAISRSPVAAPEPAPEPAVPQYPPGESESDMAPELFPNADAPPRPHAAREPVHPPRPEILAAAATDWLTAPLLSLDKPSPTNPPLAPAPGPASAPASRPVARSLPAQVDWFKRGCP